MAELWEEFLALDLRAFRTLALLVARPGRLSSEYLAGRRRGFTSPLRLYFTLTLIAALVTRGFSQERQVGVIETSLSGAHFLYTIIQVFASTIAMEVDPAVYELAGTLGPWVGLIVFSPVLGVALSRVFRKDERLFAEHLIVSIHFQSFVLLVVTLEAALLWFLPQGAIAEAVKGWVFILPVVLYSALLLREFYGIRNARLAGAWIESAIFFYVGLVAVMVILNLVGLPLLDVFMS